MFRQTLLAALALALATISATAAATEAPEKKKGGGETYLQLPTLTAGVIRADGRRGVLTVESGLNVPDEMLRARADLSTPRLRDAYTRFLGVYGGTLAPGRAPDPDAIGAGLQRATDQVLGRPGARLLLGTILVN